MIAVRAQVAEAVGGINVPDDDRLIELGRADPDVAAALAELADLHSRGGGRVQASVRAQDLATRLATKVAAHVLLAGEDPARLPRYLQFNACRLAPQLGGRSGLEDEKSSVVPATVCFAVILVILHLSLATLSRHASEETGDSSRSRVTAVGRSQEGAAVAVSAVATRAPMTQASDAVSVLRLSHFHWSLQVVVWLCVILLLFHGAVLVDMLLVALFAPRGSGKVLTCHDALALVLVIAVLVAFWGTWWAPLPFTPNSSSLAIAGTTLGIVAGTAGCIVSMFRGCQLRRR